MSLSLLNTQDNQIDLSNGIFRFMGKEANIIPDYENPLFLANDIAEILRYTITKKAIFDHVENEDKVEWSEILQRLGGTNSVPPNLSCISAVNAISIRIQNQPKTVFITESGLYSLIFSSKMKAAKEFKKWIFSNVIPSIRKTGTYSINQQLSLESEKDKEIALLRLENKKYIAEIADIKIPVVLNEYLYALKLGNRSYHKFGRTVDDEKRKKQHIPEYGQDVDYEIKMQVYHSKLAESMLKYAFEDNMVYDIYKPSKVNKKGDVSDPVEEREGTNLPTDMVCHMVKRTAEVSNEFYNEMTQYRKDNFIRIRDITEQSAKDKAIHDAKLKVEREKKRLPITSDSNINDDEKTLVIYESSANVNTNIVVYEAKEYPTLDMDEPIMPIMPVVQESIMPVIQEPIAIIKPVPVQPVITNKVVVEKSTGVVKTVVKKKVVVKPVVPKLEKSNTKDATMKFIKLLASNEIEGYPKEGGDYKISDIQDAYAKFCDMNNYPRPKDYAQFWKSGVKRFFTKKDKPNGIFTAFPCDEINCAWHL